MPRVTPPEELLPIRVAGRRLMADIEAGRLSVSEPVILLIQHRLNSDFFDDKNSLFEVSPSFLPQVIDPPRGTGTLLLGGVGPQDALLVPTADSPQLRRPPSAPLPLHFR